MCSLLKAHASVQIHTAYYRVLVYLCTSRLPLVSIHIEMNGNLEKHTKRCKTRQCALENVIHSNLQ